MIELGLLKTLYSLIWFILGAIGSSIGEFNIADHPLESIDYECAGTERNLKLCPTSILVSCQLSATVQCQGTCR